MSIPKTRTTLALVLIGSLASGARADAVSQLFTEIYPEGGESLYCQNPFSAGSTTPVERVYPDRYLEQHFQCSNSIVCRRTEGYTVARDDLHQMFPIERRAELDRRGALFGETRTEDNVSECGYRLAFQTFEPPDHAKGDIARAMLYMHTQHGVPLVGSLEMYQRWNELDPPDEAEQARNARIGDTQGNRNPYIDTPERVSEIAPALPAF